MLGVGAIQLRNMPVHVLPEFAPPYVEVQTEALGLSAQEVESLVTVNLSVDFLGSALVGQWLEFDTVFVKPGSTLAFAQAFVTADGQPCARANAVFRVVRKAAA